MNHPDVSLTAEEMAMLAEHYEAIDDALAAIVANRLQLHAVEDAHFGNIAACAARHGAIETNINAAGATIFERVASAFQLTVLANERGRAAVAAHVRNVVAGLLIPRFAESPEAARMIEPIKEQSVWWHHVNRRRDAARILRSYQRPVAALTLAPEFLSAISQVQANEALLDHPDPSPALA